MQVLGMGDRVNVGDNRIGTVLSIVPVRDKIGNLVVPMVRIGFEDGGSILMHGSAFHDCK